MKKNTVTINGRDYDVPELNNNAIIDLADNGLDIFSKNFKKKSTLSVARGIIAWIEDIDIEEAGDELQNHIVNGGNLISIVEAFNVALSNSGFIKALTERAKAEEAGVVPQDHKKKQQ